METTQTNPILTSVISSRLRAVGERMGRVVERSARSPLLVEGRDFSLGIYDIEGRLLEQTEYIPILGYAAAPAMRHIAQKFKGRVARGDALLHNDTYTGGNQASDWKILKPVFHEGEHFAWVVISAHQADVGGAVPGSYNPKATDLWQEALRIPAVKVMEAGEIREDVWDLIFGNVRLDVVAEDVTAMIGACTVGERELERLVEKYGLPTFQTVVEEVLDSTELLTRRMIASIPDGVYASSWICHDDGFDHEAEMEIVVEITVDGDHMKFDFTGTSAQGPGYVNAPLAVTLSSVMITFFMLVEGDVPHNDAIMRCIDVSVPEGTILNCSYPAASGFGNHLSDQICSVIMAALSEVLPSRVTAGWNPLLGTIINGWNPRRDQPFVDILINALKGGGGGTQDADGFDHIGLIASGGALGAQDPEMFEHTNPVFLERFEYVPDSAGAGQWRGGLGVETRMRLTTGGIQASVFGDGDTPETAAAGLRGGLNGSPNELELILPDGTVITPELKDLVSDLPEGTIYRQVAGGGGGYGDPRERSAELVALEVRRGYISAAAARRDYGVEVADDGRLDEEATAQLRA